MYIIFRIFCACLICILHVNPTLQKSLDTCDEECICRPPIQSKAAQYIIGYGSLMNGGSVKRTNPLAGEVTPVRVQGYRRVLSAQGASVSHSATFMGVEEDKNSSLNAVIFPLSLEDGKASSVKLSQSIRSIDLREAWYCRVKVPIEQIQFLDGHDPKNNEYWIYVSKPEYTARPSKDYPLVQSYVDIFLGGCLELEDKFELEGFAAECVRTTGGWNEFYVNDRIYPRRPTYYEPQAFKIDKLLEAEIPEIYKNIKFTG